MCVCVCVCVCVEKRLHLWRVPTRIADESVCMCVMKYYFRDRLSGRLFVFIFGSLGHTHRLVVRGLQQLGMPKKRAKRLEKYCSLSAISCHIWRRRLFIPITTERDD